MALSGSYNWVLNRDEVILRALQEINRLGEYDSSIPSDILAFCVYKLNGMLKMWSVDGIKLTSRKHGYLFPVASQRIYELGSASGASHVTASYNSTTISSAEALGQTVLSVTSSSGMTAADFVGIELNDGTRQWTTIVSVDSSTQITVTASLTAAAAAGNTVISYTTKLNRPLDIVYALSSDITVTNGLETELNQLSHNDYNKLSNKLLTNPSAFNFYYERNLSTTVPYLSKLYLYPVPTEVNKIVHFIYQDAIQDLDGSTDNFDLPQEWLYPVVYNLAAELAPTYGKFEELKFIQPKADKLYEMLKAASRDTTAITFKLK